jgi:hypothetical protein
MRKAKALCAGVLGLLMLASSLQLVAPSRGADTPNTVIEDLDPTAMTFMLRDTAWMPDGRVAVLAGISGAAFAYDTLDNVSPLKNIDGSNVATADLYATAWDPVNNEFLLFGVGGPTGEYFSITPGMTNIVRRTATELINVQIMDAVWNPGLFGGLGGFVLVGLQGTNGWLVFYRSMDRTFPTIAGPYLDETFNAGATDPITGETHIVGRNEGTWGPVYYTVDTALAVTSRLATGSKYYTDIEWNGTAGFGYIATGDGFSGYSILRVDSAHNLGGIYTTDPTIAFSALARDPLNDRTLVLAFNWTSNHAHMYNILRNGAGQPRVVEFNEAYTGVGTHFIHDAECRPSRQPLCLMVGDSVLGFRYTSVLSNIEVDTLFPHISYIDLYDAGTTSSRLNGQVDVDPGTSSVQYDLEARVWHNTGQASIRQVEAFLWRDNGTSEAQPGAFDAGGFGNLRMHFVWWRDNNTFFQYYPTGPQRETTLDVVNSNWTIEGDGRNITVRFTFSPHQQVRWANSSGDGWAELPGTRFDGRLPPGWNAEDQSTVAALDDFGSWNIHVEARDVGNAIADAFDEFGLFKYTYIGSSGLPGGGNVYGSGPPNTARWLSPAENVTFCANVDYRLSINCTDLIGQNLGQTIFVTDVSVRGGDLVAQTNFTAPGVPVFLFGSALPAYHAPLNYSRVTTTSSADGNPGTWEPVVYRCWIPSVPEDYYKGTLTYSVTHG